MCDVRYRLLLIVALPVITIVIVGVWHLHRPDREPQNTAADDIERLSQHQMTEHHFGDVFPGVEISRKFRFTNSHAGSMRVIRSRTTCGCSSVRIGKDTLEPGESTDVTITITTGLRTGLRSVDVLLDTLIDGKSYIAGYLLSMNVKSVIEILGPENVVEFGDIDIRQLPFLHAFEIRRGSYPLEWDSIEVKGSGDLPFKSVQVSQIGADLWRVESTINNTNVIGSLHGYIELHFKRGNIALDYFLRIPISGSISGPVAITPASWLIGRIEPGHSVQSDFVVLGADVTKVIPGTDINSEATGKTCSLLITQHQDDPTRLTVGYHAREQMKGTAAGEFVVEVIAAGELYEVKVPYLALVEDVIKNQ